MSMLPYYVTLSSVELSGTDATDKAYIVNLTGHTLKVESAYIIPNVTVATHAANYITTTLNDGVGGSAMTSHTTNSSGGSALTVGVPKALTLTEGTVLEIADGAVVEVDVAKAGTGPAYAFSVELKCRAVRA